MNAPGSNFYRDNQSEHPIGHKLGSHIEPRSERWTPLYLLLQEVFERYRRLACLIETGHIAASTLS